MEKSRKNKPFSKNTPSKHIPYKVDVKDPNFDKPISQLTKVYDGIYKREIIYQDNNFTVVKLT